MKFHVCAEISSYAEFMQLFLILDMHGTKSMAQVQHPSYGTIIYRYCDNHKRLGHAMPKRPAKQMNVIYL